MKKRPSLLRALEKRVMLDASMPVIAGQVLWLDANDTATVLDSDGTNAAGSGGNGVFSGGVQTWVDKSTSGFNVTATAAGNRPAYTTAALNSKSVLTFDGTTDFLSNTAATISGDDYTIFAVYNRTTAAGRDAILELAAGGSRNGLYINDASFAGKVSLYNNGSFYGGATTYTTSAYTLTTAMLNTTAYSLFQNGASVTSGTTTTRTATTGIYIGDDSTSGDQLQGNIAEVIIYDRDLTSDERHDMEIYLASKWGLTITNAAPTVSTNTGTTLNEGATTTITSAMLSATDTDNTDTTLIYTITDAVDWGAMFRDANSNGVVDSGEAIGLGSTFLQSDINSNLIKYAHNGLNNATDAFSFTVTDGLATSTAGTFNLSITLTGTKVQVDAISNAVLQLDAQDLDNDGLTNDQPATGTAVSLWVDSKSVINNATQASTGKQPLYNANAFGAGIGGVTYDGSNDILTQAGSSELGNGSFIAKSFGLVFRTGSNISGDQLIYETGGTSNGINFGIYGGNIYAYTFTSSADKVINLGAAAANTTYQIVAIYDNNTGIKTWSASLNGGAFISTAVTANLNGGSGAGGVGGNNGTSVSPLTLSNITNAYYKGSIGEIWMWNKALTGSEVATVQDYFQDKWFSSVVNAAPSITAIAGQSTNEDTATGAISFTIGDAETAAASLTLTGSSSDNTLVLDSNIVFSGSGANRTVTVTPEANAFGTSVISIDVDDGSGNITTRSFNLTINPVNDTPTLTAAGPFSFNENISAGTAVTTLVGSDVDTADTLTYSIQSGNTGSMFAINSATGAITFAGSPNYESVSSYNLVVRATDNGTGSLFAQQTVVVNINDLNESPLIAANTGAIVNEGASVVITTAMLNEGDVDDSGTGLTYTASSLTNGTITVNGVTQNTFTQADIDAGIVRFVHDGSETLSASFVFSLADGGENGASPATGTFNLSVTPVNDAPVIDGWSLVSSENFEAGATGWAINTTTVGGTYLSRYLGPFSNDGGVQSNSKTYALSSGQDYTVIEFDFYRMDSWDTEQFRIWINDTQVFAQAFTTSIVTIPDGSSGISSWTVSELTTTSGNAGNASGFNDQIFRFTMTIQNAGAANVKIGFGSTTNQATNDESWGIDNVKVYEADDGGTPGPFTLAENTANGQVVGKITAGDIEGNAITYSITGGTGASAFAINSSTGAITVSNSTLLNYETTPSFTLQITATDNGSPNATDVETITINLVDVPENTAPVVTAAGPFNVAENAANATVITTMAATDAEGNAVTWSITAGNTDNIFSITAGGQLRVNSNTNLNFEWNNQYVLTIAATDSGFGALVGTSNVTVNITNINEAPTFDNSAALLAANPYLFYNATTGNYYRYVSTTATYAAAGAASSAATLFGVGGHIATVTSAAENTYVRGLGGTAQLWLGGSDTAVEGTWRWDVGGSESGMQFWQGAGSGAAGSAQNGFYTNWNGATQPDNFGGNEDNLVMQNTGFWNDINGGSNAYVIEWEGSQVNVALAALQNGPYSINENAVAGTSAGFLEAFDIDSGDTKTFSKTGGTGTALFDVNASTGEITVAVGAVLNYEATNTYTLNVRVQDTAGLFATKTITININDLNEAPTLTAAGPFAFNENIAGGTAVTTMVGADVDTGQTLTYSIQSGNTGSMFAINSATGAITFAGSPNYESVSSYNLVVRATDNGTGSLFAQQTVVININDLNETPTLTAAGPFSFNENISAGTAVTTLAGADVDAGQTLTYSIQSGNTGSMFAINSATGAITFAGSPNYESVSSYNLVVRATDNGTGSLFTERTVTVNINDLNESPTALNITATSINENSAIGTVIGTLSSVDQDLPGDSFTYTIQNDPDGKFTIVGDQLRVNGALDFETATSHSVTIRTNDGNGGTFDQIFTITIGDVNEAPVVLLNTGTNVEEGRNVIISNTMLSGSDVDDGAGDITYTVSNLVNGHIEVSGITQTSFTQADIDAGVVQFVHDGSETFTASFDFSLADGGENATSPATGTFLVNVVPDGDPTLVDQSFSIRENAASGALIGTVAFSDAEDAAQDLSLSIISGNEEGLFVLGTDGRLSLAAGRSLNFEARTNYSLLIEVTDSLGQTTQGRILISVLNVDETNTDGGGTRPPTQSDQRSPELQRPLVQRSPGQETTEIIRTSLRGDFTPGARDIVRSGLFDQYGFGKREEPVRRHLIVENKPFFHRQDDNSGSGAQESRIAGIIAKAQENFDEAQAQQDKAVINFLNLLDSPEQRTSETQAAEVNNSETSNTDPFETPTNTLTEAIERASGEFSREVEAFLNRI